MFNETVETKVGVEWAEDLEKDIGENIDSLKLVELIPENFFKGRHKDFLETLQARNIPTLVHAVELSVGSAEPLREEHFQGVKRVMEQVPTVNLSDHLCMTEAGGVEIGQLTPIPYTREMADHVSRKIDEIQSRTDVPFLIENITNRFMIPDMEMTEPEFINLILERTGCGLLLDVTNVYTNGTNFKFDPYEWLDAINLKAVHAIHLAGGYVDDEGSLVDSHSRPVPHPVWEIYRHVVGRVRPAEVIVEWTEDCPPFDQLMADVQRAEQILAETAPVLRVPEMELRAQGGLV